ncbi:hypothetical protein [Rhizobium sp. G21]|uniref:hypothetical protein n=1 Tax=Rhizobium sp. G21 TaxID=2758439 RepID=UPI0015FF7ACB|nr:hypothetical protein [Rhizobium sp. G21]MBB1250793.1 hypothetical protein [Rhizobium sp. G21]
MRGIKTEGRADFELVFGEGVHPFYLGMTADQVLEAALDWKICSAEREDSSLKLVLSKQGKVIDVSLLNAFYLFPGHEPHFTVYHIATEEAAFADGKRFSRFKKEKILARFTGAHSLELMETVDDGDEAFWWQYKNSDTTLLFSEFGRPVLMMGRMPRLGFDYDV